MCLLCMGKGTRPISDEQKTLINTHLYNKYQEHAELLPQSLCPACQRKLTSLTTATPRDIPLLKFDQLVEDLQGKDSSILTTHCSCEVCVYATWNPPHPKAKRPVSKYHNPPTEPDPPPRQASPQTSVLEASLASSSLSISSPNTSQGVVCQSCFGPVEEGTDHTCNRTTRLKNVEKLLTPRSKQQLASSVIRDAREAGGSQTVSLMNPHGRPTEVTATPTNKRAKRRLNLPSPLPHSALESIQVSENMSGRAVTRTAQTLRKEGARIEPNLGKALKQKNKTLEQYFDLHSMTFSKKQEQGEHQKLTKDVVCTNDLQGLLEFIKQHRNVNNVRTQIGMDGGGGFLKVCMNVINEDRSPTQSPVTKKPTSQARFLDTGVKKLLIIGIVPNVQENYHNVKTLINACGATQFNFTLATDMKLGNILCGIMQHGSTHPCCWCEIARDFKVQEGAIPRKRTLGRIREQASLYKKSLEEGRKVKPAEFFNCIENPLFFDLSDDTEIIDLIPPPELHLMLGTTSKLYEEVLNKMQREGEDRQRIEIWAREHNIVREEYRGGAMEGNKCRTLLKKAVDLGKELPDKYRVFAVALHRLGKVVTSCFSKELVEVEGKNYEQLIQEFHEVYLACQISITPKVHALLIHVPEWCFKNQVGLGHVSEQASESVHHDFKKKWEHFKVREDNKKFGEKLKSCIVQYNSSHL